jgi:hypothetical protein
LKNKAISRVQISRFSWLAISPWRRFESGGALKKARAKQTHRVRQEANDGCQAQTVEKHAAQSQLILFVGLSGFNPRTSLPQKFPRQRRAQGNGPEHNFMVGGSKGKFTRTTSGLPAPRTEWVGFWSDSEPMQWFLFMQAEPLQFFVPERIAWPMPVPRFWAGRN